jgi:hypothetical protein
MHVGQSEPSALVLEGQPLVVEAEQVKYGGLEVVHMRSAMRS